ncbi:hypothetical protein CNR22_19990 [Sphingobacteriaceae bacterium]|nr:hypothetical protein CNR22_19990 [Sphingobacteriaceae bacterium]
MYNRWGNVVYRNKNYDNSWNGKANVSTLKFENGLLPERTYYYTLLIEEGAKKNYHGFIVIRN